MKNYNLILLSLFIFYSLKSVAQTYSKLGAWYYGQSFVANQDGYIDNFKIYSNAPNPSEVTVWMYGPFDDQVSTEEFIGGSDSSSLDNASLLMTRQVFNATDLNFQILSGEFDSDYYGFNYGQSNPNTEILLNTELGDMKIIEGKYYLMFFKVSNDVYMGDEYRTTRVVKDPGDNFIIPSWGELTGARMEIANSFHSRVQSGIRTEKITICHQTNGDANKAQTLSVNVHAWPAHEAHGDVAGECPEYYQNNGLVTNLNGYYLADEQPYQRAIGLNLDLTLSISYINKWRGNNSKNFNDPNNWSRKKVPNAKNTVIIESGYDTPEISESTNFDILVVEEGAKLYIVNGESVIVSDYLLNTGEIKGKVKLKGDHAQISAEGKLSSIEIDNDSGATLTGNTEIMESLVLTSGTLDLNNNELILKATDSTTALLIGNADQLDGMITIEQFVPQTGYGHHYLCTPMKNAQLTEIRDDFGFALGTPFPHLYYYDEPSMTWLVPESKYDSMPIGRGYTGYFYADITLDMTGYPNTGHTEIPLTAEGDGWNFIGNPYPSPLNWDSVQIPNSMVPAVYVWDHEHEIWGRYTSYVDGVAANGGSNIIPMMQAFYVQTVENTTLIFEDNCRIEEPGDKGTFFKKSQNNSPILRVNVGNDLFDNEIVLRLKDEASDQFDIMYDASLLESGNSEGIEFGIYSEDEEVLVINSVPYFVDNKQIGIYLKNGSTRNLKFSIENIEGFDEFEEILIIDSKLNVKHNLREGVYHFVGGIDDDVNRFKLDIRSSTGVTSLIEKSPNKEIVLEYESGNLILHNSIDFENLPICEVYNVLGQEVFTKSFQSSNENNYILNIDHKLNSGFYIATVSDVYSCRFYVP